MQLSQQLYEWAPVCPGFFNKAGSKINKAILALCRVCLYWLPGMWLLAVSSTKVHLRPPSLLQKVVVTCQKFLKIQCKQKNSLNFLYLFWFGFCMLSRQRHSYARSGWWKLNRNVIRYQLLYKDTECIATYVENLLQIISSTPYRDRHVGMQCSAQGGSTQARLFLNLIFLLCLCFAFPLVKQRHFSHCLILVTQHMQTFATFCIFAVLWQHARALSGGFLLAVFTW